MTTLIILIALVGIGYYLIIKDDYDLLGFTMCWIFGTWLVIHIVVLSLVSYNYGLFVTQRDAFEQTLKTAREYGNEYETAAIVKEVARWNINLAKAKYENNTIFLDQFIDDRIELLEPIK